MAETFEEWAILELMGHRKIAGLVREATIAGGAFVRIDIPAAEAGKWTVTQYYSPSSVYCMTPCTEALARQIAASYQPVPVNRYELAALPAPESHPDGGDEPDYEGEEDPEDLR
jgi:hypothetical protein